MVHDFFHQQQVEDFLFREALHLSIGVAWFCHSEIWRANKNWGKKFPNLPPFAEQNDNLRVRLEQIEEELARCWGMKLYAGYMWFWWGFLFPHSIPGSSHFRTYRVIFIQNLSEKATWVSKFPFFFHQRNESKIHLEPFNEAKPTTTSVPTTQPRWKTLISELSRGKHLSHAWWDKLSMHKDCIRIV